MQDVATGSRKIPSKDLLRGRGRRTQTVRADLASSVTNMHRCYWLLESRPQAYVIN